MRIRFRSPGRGVDLLSCDRRPLQPKYRNRVAHYRGHQAASLYLVRHCSGMSLNRTRFLRVNFMQLIGAICAAAIIRGLMPGPLAVKYVRSR